MLPFPEIKASTFTTRPIEYNAAVAFGTYETAFGCPGALWRLIEKKQHFTAAWLFLLSRVVYRALVNDDEQDEDAWQHQGIDVLDACAALLTLHLLDSKPLVETFNIFLAQRSRALRTASTPASEASSGNGHVPAMSRKRNTVPKPSAVQKQADATNSAVVNYNYCEGLQIIYFDSPNQPSLLTSVLRASTARPPFCVYIPRIISEVQVCLQQQLEYRTALLDEVLSTLENCAKSLQRDLACIQSRDNVDAKAVHLSEANGFCEGVVSILQAASSDDNNGALSSFVALRSDTIYATAATALRSLLGYLTGCPTHLPTHDLGCQREEANCMFLTILIGAEDTPSCLISSVL
ncbi:Conserved oligomeric Golgi complex [Salix suchowensis]|nr:Conserved oligomeric Golgi complex [Salix suchowensis]